MESSVRYCTPSCEFFKCGNRSLLRRGRVILCSLTMEECNPVKCQYPICLRHRLLANGVCGLTVKRRTEEKKPEEEPKIVPSRLRGKIRELEELF